MGLSQEKHQAGRLAYETGAIRYYNGPGAVQDRQCIIGVEFKAPCEHRLRTRALDLIQTYEQSHLSTLFLYGRNAKLHCSAVVLEADEQEFDLAEWKQFCLDAETRLHQLCAEARLNLEQRFSQLVVAPDSILATEDEPSAKLEQFRDEAVSQILDLLSSYPKSLYLRVKFSRPPWAHICLARPVSLAREHQQSFFERMEALKRAFEQSPPLKMQAHAVFVRHCTEYLS